MLTNNNNLNDLVIRAAEGEIGTVDEIYFDDLSWAIRSFIPPLTTSLR